MKKIIACSFLSLFIAGASLFAAEIVFAPSVGGSLYTVNSPVEVSVPADKNQLDSYSKKAVAFILPLPSFGLDAHFTNENSGFTFSLVNNLGVPITLYRKGGFGDESRKALGFAWDGQMLFGYTYGVKKDFALTVGVGPGFALGLFNAIPNEKRILSVYYNLSPIGAHMAFRYYFTEHAGISVNIYDSVGISGLVLDKKTNAAGTFGIGNVFTLKLGAAFRL
ncbi:DUF2715 domain-containing protein [Treponema phagedenis]|uniref:DUF2715 domain-containing protein n=1 Tax=Treponema phagedenis TaxID=162 RepID=UPI0001F6386E|nr:DUF2715 domain-containing protein [Treponema phagedenis]EFW36727.1 hypothetical protein HMPREF9554_02843 [Treponema phagedenis F0421]TYT78966.1 DUF2715 domain-containing protein [Treponema phagedenis]